MGLATTERESSTIWTIKNGFQSGSHLIFYTGGKFRRIKFRTPKLFVAPCTTQVNGLSTGDSHVGNQGTNPGLGPQSSTRPRLSTVVHRLSTGYPPGLSPGLWRALGRYRPVVPRTFNRKSTRFHRTWTTSSLSVSVHIDFPRVRPHLWGVVVGVVHRWG